MASFRLLDRLDIDGVFEVRLDKFGGYIAINKGLVFEYFEVKWDRCWNPIYNELIQRPFGSLDAFVSCWRPNNEFR